jgi:hypothetical protein
MMKKQEAGQLLSESVAGRLVTAIGFDEVDHELHGEVYMPYFEVDHFLKVGLAYALPKGGVPRAYKRKLKGRYQGKICHGVVVFPRETARRSAGLVLWDTKELLPVWSFGLAANDDECELNKTLISAGLQATCEFAADA